MQGITAGRARPSRSPTMARAPAGAGRRDPAAIPNVESLSSFIGVDGTNNTLNSGRFLINLKPKDDRSDSDQRRASAASRTRAHGVPGISLYLQPVQDLTIDSTVSRAQYQFVLEDASSATLTAMGAQAARRSLQRAPELAERLDQFLDRGLSAHGGGRPRHRGALRHHGGDHRQCALRRLRPAHHLDHLHPVEPVSRDPGGRSGRAELARLALRHLSAVGRRRAGAAVGLRARRAAAGAAGDRSSRPVPRRDDLLRRGAGLFAGRARSTRSSRREADAGLPASITTNFQGSALAFQSALVNELLLILAAIVTVYIVLGVLYESFIHPVTILSTLPSAGVGALLCADHHRQRSRHRLDHRHHPADRHRQEERDHDDRLRARGRARRRQVARARRSIRRRCCASVRS